MLILVAGLTYSNMHWRSSPKFVALLQLQNKDTSAPKNTPPPLFAHYFVAKVGRGCLHKYSICLMHVPPHSILQKPLIYIQSTIMMTDVAFRLEEWQLC